MSNEPRPRAEPFALALVALLFVEHLLFGANRQDLALLFAAAHLLLLAALILVSRGDEPPRLPLGPAAALLGGVFLLGLVSLLPLGPPLAHPLWDYVRRLQPGVPASISLDPLATRVQLVKLAGLAAVFLVAASLGARRESAERTGRYLTVAGILYAAWAALAWLTEPNAIFGAPRPYLLGRLSGSFLSPNTAGTLFAALAVMGLTGLLRPLVRERRPGEPVRAREFAALWPQGLLAGLSLACLFLSASRGGLLALLAATLFALGLIVWARSSRRSPTGGVLAAACLVPMVGIAAFLLAGEPTARRLAAFDPVSEDRLKIFAAYWPTFRASPWLGYGLGAFPWFNAASMTAGNAVALADIGAAHNVYIQWLLQQGVPGALCMFGAVGLVLAAAARGVVRRARQQALGVAWLAACVVFAVHGLTDYALEVPSMAAFFSALLGLGYGLAERPASGRRRSAA